MQNGGNLVISTQGATLWSRLSGLVSNNKLNPGQVLLPGQHIFSANGVYELIMQTQGNLVEYGFGRALWYTPTRGTNYLIMQRDGNLVIYNGARQPLWYTGTYNHPGSYLILQNDGNLVIYNGAHQPLWYNGV